MPWHNGQSKPCLGSLSVVIIIIKEFHRDANLTKTSGPLCVTCFTSVNGTVAGGMRCRMIYGTVRSSVRSCAFSWRCNNLTWGTL